MSTDVIPTELTRVALREAFGAHPTGVVAVVGQVGDDVTGLAASSFTSVSLEPPLVSFSVANDSRTWPALRRAHVLALDVLADHHGEWVRQLAGPVDHRFDDVRLERGDAALHVSDALVKIEASIEREIPAGDHTIVLLRVDRLEGPGAGAPLVFHRSAFTELRDAALDRGDSARAR